MKRCVSTVVSMAILASMVSYAATTTSSKTKAPIKKPVLESMVGVSGITSNTPLKQGRPYVLAERPYLTVLQNSGNAALIHINSGITSALSFIPDSFLLQTTKPYVDNSLLPVPTCGIYNGVTQYTTVLGAVKSVHKFTEVPCKNYALPAGARMPNYPSNPIKAFSKVNGEVAAMTARTSPVQPDNDSQTVDTPDPQVRVKQAETALKTNQVPAKQKEFIERLVQDYSDFYQNKESQLPGLWQLLGLSVSREENQNNTEAIHSKNAFLNGNTEYLKTLFADDYLGFKKGDEAFIESTWQALEKETLPINKPLAEYGFPQQAKSIQSLNQNRWKEAYRSNKGIAYIDVSTVERQYFPSTLNNGNAPLQYTFWQRNVLLPFKQITEPQKSTVVCASRLFNGAYIQPESSEEGIFKYFCQSIDAQNALQQIKYKQQEVQYQQNQGLRQTQQQAQQIQTRTNLNQGINTLYQLLPFIRY